MIFIYLTLEKVHKICICNTSFLVYNKNLFKYILSQKICANIFDLK